MAKPDTLTYRNIQTFCRRNKLLIHGTDLPNLDRICPKTPGAWAGSQSEYVICATNSVAHAMKHSMNKQTRVPDQYILAEFRILGIPWLFYSVNKTKTRPPDNLNCYLYLLDKKDFTKRKYKFRLNLHSAGIVRNNHSEWTCPVDKTPVKMVSIPLSEIPKKPFYHQPGDRARRIIWRSWLRM